MSVDLAYRSLQFLVAAAAFFLAYNSFERRSIQIGEEPTLPRYFAPGSLYWLGLVFYSTFMASLALALVSAWLPIRPLVEVVVSNLAQGSPARLLDSLGAASLIPLIGGGVFVALIGWESRLNPMLLVRDAVYDVFAIPRKAMEVYNVLRTSRLASVDPKIREQSMIRLLVPSLDLGDFDKASDTVEYKWARNCVLFDKIQSYADRESYRRFFKEPSLKWGQICISFNEMSEKVANWKSAEPHYTKTVHLIERLDRLTGLLCRLLACLVVFGSASDREIWETVIRLGGDPRQARLKHTYKYLLTFSGAIVIAVMLGREFAIFLYNTSFDTESRLHHFSFGTFRWIVYALTMYILPIALVFGARVEAYRLASSDATRYYGFYIIMMMVGFLVSTSVSALITGLAAADGGDFNFARSFADAMRWGILPALMCGFVAYQMDSPVDETEPRGRMFALASLRLALWALIGLVIMLYATDEMVLDQPGLRFTIVVTSVFVSGLLGAVARFKLVRVGDWRPSSLAGR